MTSSPTATILCPTCGKANETDSRFCRYCGASLEGAKSEDSIPDEEGDADIESRIAAHTPIITPLHLAPEHTDSDEDDEKLSSPAEIDARRARQLLDRALHLSERGDAAAAILACRQSIALAPNSPGGYSMLGLLLERTGNFARAITAYEKVVELSPSSAMERESIERLREKLSKQQKSTTVPFHFDDADLFGANSVVKPGAAKADVAKTDSAQPIETPLEDNEDLHLNISAAAPGLPAAPGGNKETPAETSTPGTPTLAQTIAAQLPAVARQVSDEREFAERDFSERRVGDRRKTSVPVMKERRLHTERRGNAAYGKKGNVAKVAPIFLGDVAKSDKTWDKLWQRPSFYGRSLPLAGATILCLGFLLWARGFAVARTTDAIAAAPTRNDPAPAAQTNTSAPAPEAPRVGSLPPLTSSNQSGGFPISNQPISQGQPSGGNVQGVIPRPQAPATNSSAPRTGSSQRRQPQFPNTLAPAIVPPPAASPNRNTPSRRDDDSDRGSGGAIPGLSAPNIGSQAPAQPPVVVLPPGSNTPPLNPSGNSGRGYVRITQGRIGTSALPSRPSSQASAEERNAANAARNGNTDRAIERLSSAVDADASDAGFRYQQRAMLFLDRGDYARAADDFQAAISAYGEQIEKGEQVAAARAGQRAARNGLNLALAGRGR